VKRRTRDKAIDDDEGDWISRYPQCHLQELIIEILECALLLVEGVGDVQCARGRSAQSEDRQDCLGVSGVHLAVAHAGTYQSYSDRGYQSRK
jgi:hypothetical protein